MFRPIADVGLSKHILAVSDSDTTQPTFGERHPVLISLMLVFALGFFSGGFFAEDGFLRGALSTAFGITIFVLIACSGPVLVFTVAQSINSALRPKPPQDVGSKLSEGGEAKSVKPFLPRFFSNLDRTISFVIQGLTP